jgi:hypothetical protein
MAKTLLMKTWLMVVVVALALALAASVGPFAEDANARDCEDCIPGGKNYPADTSGGGVFWDNCMNLNNWYRPC